MKLMELEIKTLVLKKEKSGNKRKKKKQNTSTIGYTWHKPRVRCSMFRSFDVAWDLVFDLMTIYDIMLSLSCLAV